MLVNSVLLHYNLFHWGQKDKEVLQVIRKNIKQQLKILLVQHRKIQILRCIPDGINTDANSPYTDVCLKLKILLTNHEITGIPNRKQWDSKCSYKWKPVN